MERVLDRLVRGEVPGESVQTKGIWLEGFGVVFSVSYPPSRDISFPVSADTATSSEAGQSAERLAHLYPKLSRKATLARNRAAVDSAKAALITFFSRWAGAMAKLRPEHRVTVIVDFQEAVDFFPVPSGQTRSSEKPTRRLIAMAWGKDILAVRRGSIPLVVFERQLQFTEEKETSAQSELNILADIVNSHLRTRGEVFFPRPTRAIRVPGLGAVLISSGYTTHFYPVAGQLMSLEQSMRQLQESAEYMQQAQRQLEELSRLYRAMEPDTLVSLKTHEDTQRMAAELSKVEHRWRDEVAKSAAQRRAEEATRAQELQRLEDEILALLGRYGAALQTLTDQELILALIDVRPYGDYGPSRLHIAVKMREVRRLAREEISFQQFRSLAAVTRE